MTTAPPLVSVIVNCRNGERYLREALDSVYAQSSSDWEIVFWDNLSTDRSGAIAKSYGEKVRYCREGPFSLHAARNRAIAVARGRYLAFLDTDDTWLSDKLELQTSVFDRDPAVGLVFTNAEFFDDGGGRRLRYTRQRHGGRIFEQLLAHYDLLLPAVMIRRDAYDAAGGFDETMEVAGDADLFLRICATWKTAYVSAVSARYRQHQSSLSACRPELHLRESELILQKLRTLIPDLDRRYAPSIVRFVGQRRKAYAVASWRLGDAPGARAQALAYCRSALPMLAVWLLSYCPFALFDALRHRNPLTRTAWTKTR